MAKRKTKHNNQRGGQRGESRAARAAHKILEQTIWPSDLQFDEAIKALAIVVRELVLSNTSEDEPLDRSEAIEDAEMWFIEVLAEIDPLADGAHVWLIPPQGLITEPFGIFWDGMYEKNSVTGFLGAELDRLRVEYAETHDETGVVIIDGVYGIAGVVPDWDGADTIMCANPECGITHDVHLKVAEELFQHAIDRKNQRLGSN